VSLDRPLWVRQSRLFGLRRAIAVSLTKPLRGTTDNRRGKGKPVAKLSRRQAERMMLRHGLRGQLTKRWVTRQTTSRAA
jgi:hypothetical protein